MNPKEIIAAHMKRIGKRGGKATSDAKTEAARRNAKLPRGKKRKTKHGTQNH